MWYNLTQNHFAFSSFQRRNTTFVSNEGQPTRKVLSVSSTTARVTVQIMLVREFPPREDWRILVSLESRKFLKLREGFQNLFFIETALTSQHNKLWSDLLDIGQNNKTFLSQRVWMKHRKRLHDLCLKLTYMHATKEKRFTTRIVSFENKVMKEIAQNSFETVSLRWSRAALVFFAYLVNDLTQNHQAFVNMATFFESLAFRTGLTCTFRASQINEVLEKSSCDMNPSLKTWIKSQETAIQHAFNLGLKCVVVAVKPKIGKEKQESFSRNYVTNFIPSYFKRKQHSSWNA